MALHSNKPNKHCYKECKRTQSRNESHCSKLYSTSHNWRQVLIQVNSTQELKEAAYIADKNLFPSEGSWLHSIGKTYSGWQASHHHVGPVQASPANELTSWLKSTPVDMSPLPWP